MGLMLPILHSLVVQSAILSCVTFPSVSPVLLDGFISAILMAWKEPRASSSVPPPVVPQVGLQGTVQKIQKVFKSSKLGYGQDGGLVLRLQPPLYRETGKNPVCHPVSLHFAFSNYMSSACIDELLQLFCSLFSSTVLHKSTALFKGTHSA